MRVFLLSLVAPLACLFEAGLLQAQEVDYLRDIKPILKERCFACHGVLQQKAKLRLDTGELIRKGGRHGAAVLPGKPAASLLIERVTATEESERMPPEGKPLTPRQIALIEAWVSQGAKSPLAEKAEADPRRHWAFQKPVRPEVPKVADPTWVRNPIDAFLALEHGKHGLKVSSSADKPILLRRLYLDLIGLPPTRQELKAFMDDRSPTAYERVVDRLLGSPQYAERWARHWMDVWRYSDWYGRRAVPDVLNSYAMIWRWRDWIVRSIDQDKGYDWMIQQMLAADEISPADDSNLPATGFIVRNFFRWNYNQWKKDLVEHTGKAFLGLTLNCCHCHDHKYDPITQEEYFKFRAFFEPIEIRHDRVPGEPDPGPYPKYIYGSAHGPIKSGMVRIYDETLDAKTYMYSGGDQRNKIPGKPPVDPGAPAILAGEVKIEPLSLPAAAWYPGLKPFVKEEEVRKSEKAIRDAAAELASLQATQEKRQQASHVMELAVRAAQAKIAAARAEFDCLKARIDADRTRFGDPFTFRARTKAGERETPSKNLEAGAKERQAALAKVRYLLAAAEHALAEAESRPRSDPKRASQVQQSSSKVTQARVALIQALTAVKQPNSDYTPLSSTFPQKSTGRRTALARWIASKDNPLSARVAVNYLWGWHFGRPIVDTTVDLGRNGKRPSHPDLLDWLAVEFMDHGWQMKHLHRLIVTSNAYQMRSNLLSRERQRPEDNPNLGIDPDNRYLWRFNPGRMEAEVVRDSVLHLAGQLDPAKGGPEIPQEQGLASNRRSIYFAHHGEAKMQFLELFDAASACDAYKRTVSVLPQQALAMSNSELTLKLSRGLARQLWQEIAGGKEAAQDEAFIRAAFEQVLSRPPSRAEAAASSIFLERQEKLFRESGLKGGTPTVDLPSTDPVVRARENLVHALLNHNDFVTIR